MSRLTIYLLRDPENHVPKFVGVTKSLRYIRKQHPSRWGYQRNVAQKEWLKDLVHRNLRPEIKFITYAEPSEAHWRRQMIIKKLSSLGWDLLNRREEEAKKKRSARMMQMWKEEIYRKKNLSSRENSSFQNIYQEKLNSADGPSSSPGPQK